MAAGLRGQFTRAGLSGEDLGGVLTLRRLRTAEEKVVEIQPVLFFPRDNYGRYLHPSWRQHGIAIQEWREKIIFKVEQWAVASSREDRTVVLKNGFAGGSWDYRAYRGGTFVNVYNELEHARWEHDWEYSLCDGNWHSHFDDDGNVVVGGGWFGPDSVSMCASWMHALSYHQPTRDHS